MFIQYLMKAFSLTWGLLWEVPAPQFKLHESKLDHVIVNRLVLIMFPILGLLAGTVLILLGHLVAPIPGRYAETVLFAAFAMILVEVFSGARGLSYISSCLELYTQKNETAKCIFGASTDIHSERGPVGLVFIFILLLVRAVCFGLILRGGGSSWFIVVFVLSYTVQFQLAGLNSLVDNEPFVKSDPNMEWLVWLFAVLLVLWLGGYVVPALVAVVISVIVAAGVKRLMDQVFEGTTAGIISGIGYIIETLILIIGAAALEG